MIGDLDVQQWNRQLLQRDVVVTVQEAVLRTGGIYSTAPTSYLSFVARVPEFRRSDLERALYEDRTLVRMSALRGSAFLIPIEMIDVVVAGSDRRDLFAEWAENLVGPERVAGWRADLRVLLDGRVLPARAIRKEFGISGRDAEALRYVLSSMTVRRELASASGPKSWRDNQYGYALWSQWFPDHPPQTLDPGRARAALAEWYLRGHGPAEAEDFAWFAGMKKANAAAAIEASGAIEVGDGLLDIPEAAIDARPAGLRLLPVWDTALVRQKQWRRMVPEHLYRYVYDVSGNVTSTIVRDGEVVGVWDRSGDNDRIEITAAFFEPAGRSDQRRLKDEAAVIASALDVTELEVSFVSSPVDLHTASRNRFMSPLSGS